MWARQHAWLSTPEDAPVKTKDGSPGPDRPTRWAKLEKKGKEIDLPDLDGDDAIAGWLMDAGPLASGGMAPAPISWRELAAWAGMTGYEPDPWAAETLMAMSRAYLAEVERSNGQQVPAPFMPRMEPEKVSKTLGEILDGMMAAQAEKKRKGRR
ncbi:hypothetical protein [Frigidibacter sp. MR17.24]|uniref:hypothetical protein n=1 Tax=Frigidibacter sp. MR17.24 TaxID=3127345 RepID=UPI003012BC13